MYLQDFKKLYKFIEDDAFVYFVPLRKIGTSKHDPLSKEIAKEVLKLGSSYIPANINIHDRFVTLQNFAKATNKRSNCLLTRHKTLMPIVSQMGLNIDELIRREVVLVKSIESCQRQEERKRTQRKQPIRPLGNTRITEELRMWVDDTYKELKKKETKSEDILYKRLRKTFKNRLRRQAPFVINGNVYYADLCLKSLRTIIEVDGGYHNTPEQKAKDMRRDSDFASIGYETIRCTNEQVTNKGFVKQLVERLLEKKKATKKCN